MHKYLSKILCYKFVSTILTSIFVLNFHVSIMYLKTLYICKWNYMYFESIDDFWVFDVWGFDWSFLFDYWAWYMKQFAKFELKFIESQEGIFANFKINNLQIFRNFGNFPKFFLVLITKFSCKIWKNTQVSSTVS